VKVNGERTTPGSRIKCGDQIDLIRERLPYSLSVTNIPSRRGPAAEARKSYLEDDLRPTETGRSRRLWILDGC